MVLVHETMSHHYILIPLQRDGLALANQFHSPVEGTFEGLVVKAQKLEAFHWVGLKYPVH